MKCAHPGCLRTVSAPRRRLGLVTCAYHLPPNIEAAEEKTSVEAFAPENLEAWMDILLPVPPQSKRMETIARSVLEEWSSNLAENIQKEFDEWKEVPMV